jgi:hypothetical protein
MRLSYSLIHIRTSERSAHDSYQRQLARTQAYCDRNHLEIDEELTLLDPGGPFFEYRNALLEFLGGFLGAVERGEVPGDTRLIVESLDRPGRGGNLEALDLLKRLLAAGVEIVTLQPERLLTRASLHDTGSLMEVVGLVNK